MIKCSHEKVLFSIDDNPMGKCSACYAPVIMQDYLAFLKAEIDKLKDQHQSHPNQWIAVEDRLPENSNEVLAFCGFESQAWEFWLCAYIDGGWFSGTDSINVTHWCPLPEPPKEGE